MKINVNRKSLITCLTMVSKALPTRSLLPINNNLLFVVSKGSCYVYARNGSLQIKGVFAVDSQEDFSMCIPGGTLINTVKLLGDDEIVFKYDAEKFNLIISAGKKKYTMKGFDPENFRPQVVSGDDNISLKIPATEIIGHIKSLSTIIDWSDLRTQIAGITFLVNKGLLEITGAHGGSIFYRGITEVKPDKEFHMVIPRDVSAAISDTKGNGDFEVVIGKKSVSFSNEGFEFISVLLDVQSPILIEKYMINDSDKYFVVDKEPFMLSLRRLSNYSNENHSLRMNLNGESLSLVSENPKFSIGAEEVLDVKNVRANDIVTGINIRFLMLVISNIKGDKVKIMIESHNKPIYIQDYEVKTDKELWACGALSIVQPD